jgi:hypothetical protein
MVFMYACKPSGLSTVDLSNLISIKSLGFAKILKIKLTS